MATPPCAIAAGPDTSWPSAVAQVAARKAGVKLTPDSTVDMLPREGGVVSASDGKRCRSGESSSSPAFAIEGTELIELIELIEQGSTELLEHRRLNVDAEGKYLRADKKR